MEFLKSSSTEESCTILWDQHLDWRDEDTGATLLHIACWTGNINLLRTFSNDISVGFYSIFFLSLVSAVLISPREENCLLSPPRPASHH